MNDNHVRLLRLILYNFQSYKKQVVEFDTYSTAILGQTDKGKSVLTRAINFVLYGKPSGQLDELIRYGQNHMYAIMEFSNGYKVMRGRRNGSNYYKVINPDKSFDTFTGFGFSVPEVIFDIHGMKELEIDEGMSVSLNVTQQMDPVFLFSSSASKSARVIGSISGADKADGTLAIVSQWGKSKTRDIRDIKKAIKDKEEKLASFSFLDSLKENIISLKTIAAEYDITDDTITSMIGLMESYTELTSVQTNLNTIVECESMLTEQGELMVKMESLAHFIDYITNVMLVMNNLNSEAQSIKPLVAAQNEITVFSNTIDELTEAYRALEVITRLYSVYSTLQASLDSTLSAIQLEENEIKFEALINEVEDKAATLNTVVNLVDNHIRLVSRYSTGESVVEKLTADYEAACAAYEGALHTLGHCPTCGADII